MTSEPIQPGPAPQSTSSRIQALLIVTALTLLATLPLIVTGNNHGRAAADDYNYHWIAIQTFAIQWPAPDVSDYHSATTPGYHLVLAPLVKMGMGHQGAQIVAMGWTLAFFGLLCWAASRSLGRGAAWVMLPLIASMYTLYPGVWLLPDNAGWFFVLAILLLCLREKAGWGTWLCCGALLMALVLMRQVHIWIAGVVWLSAWLGRGTRAPSDVRAFFSDPASRIGRAMIAMALSVPGFALLGWFLMLWGGLVPPMFQGNHQGPNPATPGFILMQLGILSVFFAPLLLPRLPALWAHHWRWVILALGVGMLCGLVPASSYAVDHGRYGGWWSIIKALPSIADRSPVFVLGSIAGALALALWLSLAPRRDIWIWVGTLVAFTLAQSANFASWQRYHEPLLLVMIALIIARPGLIAPSRTRALGGALALAAMLGAINALELARSAPYTPKEHTPEAALGEPLDTPIQRQS